MNLLADHNAARLHQTKHPLAAKLAKEYAAGKSIDKYLKDENAIAVFNRAGTTVAAVVNHIKATVKIKEQD